MAHVWADACRLDEHWHAIPGHEGYQASNAGRIRSIDRLLDDGRYRCGTVLKPWLAGAGYDYVSLGKGFKTGVHRMVALAFHGPAPIEKPEAAHLNGDRRDNRAHNIVWASRSENEQHKLAHGTYFNRPRSVGIDHHKAKLTEAAVFQIRRSAVRKRGELGQLATAYGVSRRRPCRRPHGPGGMAQYRQAQGSKEPHHHPAALTLARTQPGRECLAISSPKLAIQPRLRNLRRHPRRRLRRLEPPQRSTRNHHIHRLERLGACRSITHAVGISVCPEKRSCPLTWCNSPAVAAPLAQRAHHGAQ